MAAMACLERPVSVANPDDAAIDATTHRHDQLWALSRREPSSAPDRFSRIVGPPPGI